MEIEEVDKKEENEKKEKGEKKVVVTRPKILNNPFRILN